MAILVLGGAGYIGSHMVDRLVEKGQEKVVVVDSLVTGHRAAVHPDAIFYQGDLSDRILWCCFKNWNFFWNSVSCCC